MSLENNKNKTSIEKLKRIVIKEEYVKLLGCMKEAIILNQFIYWIDKKQDYKDFFLEEKENYLNGFELTEPFQAKYGWIYKTAEELSEEVLLFDNPTTIRRTIKKIITKGYLLERRNPKFKIDRTYQYRPNMNLIMKDLNNLGFNVNYELLVNIERHRRNIDIKLQNSGLNMQNNSTNLYYRKSDMQNAGTIPENTTESSQSENTTSNSIDLVGRYFLKLCGKSDLNFKDIESIQQVLNLGLEVNDVIDLIGVCFSRYIGDGIKSFKYIEKFIVGHLNLSTKVKGENKSDGYNARNFKENAGDGKTGSEQDWTEGYKIKSRDFDYDF